MAIHKILIVDDSATDLKTLQSAVEAADCMIVTARSGAEAVAKASAEQPDLIFMDIVMDDMNGYDACREIKANPKTAHIPVIFVSSKQQKADHLWAKRQGGDGLVGKPYSPEQIASQIDRLA